MRQNILPIPRIRPILLQMPSPLATQAILATRFGVVARAHGMTQVERDTGMKRQALYRALSTKGNPTLDTLLKVTRALGLKVTIEPVVA